MASEHTASIGATPFLSARARTLCLALVVLGALAFVWNARSTPERAWAVYLVNVLFWSGLSATGVLLAGVWRTTNAGWGRVLRGAALATSGYFPVALLTFLPLYLGKEHIFTWIHGMKAHRAAWLEPNFVVTRNFLALLLFCLAASVYAYFVLRPSAGAAAANENRLRAFVTRGWQGEAKETARSESVLRWMTPALLVLYALVFSLAAFDLIMALDETFSSTLFGGHYFATNFYAELALLAVLLGAWLEREPRLGEIFTAEELHPLGKLMFGFCMFYGMMFWSQYLVFWYGNLLEEIPFVMLRQNTMPWKPFAYTAIFMVLVIPFCILLSASVKKNARTLAPVALMIVAGMWLERFTLIVPSVLTRGRSTEAVVLAANAAEHAATNIVPIGVLDVVTTFGFAAAFLLCYHAFARAFPVTLGVPPRDAHRH